MGNVAVPSTDRKSKTVPLYVDDTVLGFTFKDAVYHVAQYKFNFTFKS